MVICTYTAECLQVTPGTGASTGTPIQYLAKQLSWQLLSEENCFQVIHLFLIYYDFQLFIYIYYLLFTIYYLSFILMTIILLIKMTAV